MNPRELTEIGPYRVRRFIAEGGMAWVFEVIDPRFDAARALKMLKPEASSGDDFQRFEAEASLLAGIDHPNLITIYDFGQDEGTGCFYYTMTYVDSPPLSQRGVMTTAEAGPLFLDVLAGLAVLHDRGVVHRDIKPANVLQTTDGRALVADLGIARQTDRAGVTRTGMAVGTALYMAPEQARGRNLTPRVDVYSVGLSLYQVLTGTTVWDGVDDIDTSSGSDVLLYLGGLLHSGKELSFDYPNDVPPALRRVITKACRLDPDARYADAREMHEALYEAVYDAGKSDDWRRLALGAGAGAGVVAAIVAAVMLWPPAALDLARDRLQEIDELERRAASLLFESATLEPAPSAELLSGLREGVAAAQVFRSQGREAIDEERHVDAMEALEQAAQTYRAACARLTGEHLHARVDPIATAVRDRASLYRTAGGPELAKTSWPGFELALERIAPPDPELGACAVAEAELARIGALPGAREALSAVEAELATELPRLAEIARTSASAARQAAEADTAEVAAFRDVLNAGLVAFGQAETQRANDDFLGAVERYRTAEAFFATAREIAPAGRLRQKTESLEARARSELDDLGVVQASLDEAQAAWERGEWATASTAYENSIGLLESLLSDLGASRAALAASGAATRERDAALSAGAGASASAEIGAAEALQTRATEALEAKQYAAAERDFRAASEQFRVAREASVGALAEARALQVEARMAAERLPEACAGLSESAAQDCAAGGAAQVTGDEALVARDAPTALAHFRIAKERFASAAESERAYLQNLPRPPRIVAREPAADQVRVHRNETIAFSVEASDPNGDTLEYRWRRDGRRLDASGSELVLSPDADTRIEVEVRDGQGGRVEAAWAVAFRNRAPTLRVYPDEARTRLELGDSREFRVDASDPDGEPVRTEFAVDGRTVAQGSRYTFRPSRAGNYVVSARAVDASGARTRVERRVEVFEKRVAVAPVPKPTPRPTPKPTTTPKPSRLDPEKGAIAALDRYRSAYEAQDLEALSAVWIMNPKQREAMQQLFEHADRIDVQIARHGIDVTRDVVSIDFDQEVDAVGSRMTTKSEPVPMTATVIHTGGGQWKISSILPRR
ncbi:MAG: protein kinase [Myxococcota bacterium]